MFDDDIFKEFKRLMNRQFGFNDDFFKNDWNDDMEDIFNEFKSIKTGKEKNDKKSKSYSISYRYGTGMKEPEIKVEGDVDDATLNRFLEGVQRRFNTSTLQGKKVNLLKPHIEKQQEQTEDSEEEIEAEAVIPFTDIHKTDNGSKITLEMPGISVDQVKVTIKEKGIDVHAEHSDKKYHKHVNLSFKPQNNPKISANNGIITIEIEKEK